MVGNSADTPGEDLERRATQLLSSGGDARITLDAATGTNRYHSAPCPRDVLAYASSTANDISRTAFDHVCNLLEKPQESYAHRLAALRRRLTTTYGFDRQCDVVLAASGTDLEYVALAIVAGRARGGIHNVLLGANEVGSGCIHSAHGRYFADQTARGIESTPATPVVGLENVSLADIPIRDENGTARRGSEVVDDIQQQIALAVQQDRHALVHVLHGSKTGLIAPGFSDILTLADRWGDKMTFVIDACQARLSERAARSYCAAGCILLVTGSKFMGGPPFSGMAIIPPEQRARSGQLPQGLERVFLREEWPENWPGADLLTPGDNEGLWLRLEASLFELERYHAITPDQRAEICAAFNRAVMREIVEPLGFELILPHHPSEPHRGAAHPTAMQSLVTFTLMERGELATFNRSVSVHSGLLDHGIRLGQPVRCKKRSDRQWAGTLRVGLSMPQVSALAEIAPDDREDHLTHDMRRIAAALRELTH